MKNTRLKRLVATLLSLLMLFGCFSVQAAATEGADAQEASVDADLADALVYDIEEVKAVLNALSYSDYSIRTQRQPKATKTVNIDVFDLTYGTTDKGGNAIVKTTSGVAKETEYFRVETVDGQTNSYPVQSLQGSGDSLYIPSGEKAVWTFDVPENGKYAVKVYYASTGNNRSTSIELSASIDGQSPFKGLRYLTLTKNWKANVVSWDERDSLKNGLRLANENATVENGPYKFQTDINKNDIKANLSEVPVWSWYTFKDATGYDVLPYEIHFTEGEHELEFEVLRDEIYIKEIVLCPLEDSLSYYDYVEEEAARIIAENDDINGMADLYIGGNPIKIEAELPTASSDKTIIPVNDRSSAITSPQDATVTKLNAIGGTKWQTVGQWLEYKFTPDQTGFYYIAPRFKQSDLDGIYVTRSFYIAKDGEELEIPFEEANYLQFNYSSEWQSKPLNNGENEFAFLFEAGHEYTIRFEVALGNIGKILERANKSMTSMNADYLKILQITGADPDTYRDYNFRVLIPGVLQDLYNQSVEIDSISNELEAISGSKSSNTASLDNISRILSKMAKKESAVAKNLTTMKSYIGTLGTWVNSSQNQPLTFDYISICPASNRAGLPRAEASFTESAGFEISAFFQSFFTDYSNLGAIKELDEDEVVEVWITGGRDQAQIVRSLIDNNFTSNEEYGIGVNLKLIAGGTLLPATLSGAGPDVSLSNAQGDPIQYAIRNAVVGLNDMDCDCPDIKDENGQWITQHTEDCPTKLDYNKQFGQVIKRFPDAAMIPLTLYGTTYGLPETMSFSMLFYRKDVFAELGLNVPRTWEELMEIIPVLQYNNMEVGIPSSTGGLNLLMYQMSDPAEKEKESIDDQNIVYADKGMRINYDSKVALQAFDTMCSYFTNYGFPVTYDFANRFRTGELPLGFSDYVGSYNQLTIFATEIRDLWEFIPIIGYEHEDGTINNDSLVTVAPMMMMEGVNNKKNAWLFMQWFVSKDTQVEYSNDVVATIGQGAMYATANMEALEELPWSTSDKNNIYEQIKHLSSLPEYPGGYILGRYTNFAFLDAYNNDADPAEALLGYVDDINKEITRKRQEFGLDTLELGETLAEREAKAAEAQKK